MKKNTYSLGKIFGRIIIALFLFSLIFSHQLAPALAENQSAVDALNNLNQILNNENIPTGESASVYQTVSAIINIVMGLLAVFFLVLIIFYGVNWMYSKGNEERINISAQGMGNAAIGLAITVTAFLITNYVILKLIEIIIE